MAVVFAIAIVIAIIVPIGIVTVAVVAHTCAVEIGRGDGAIIITGPHDVARLSPEHSDAPAIRGMERITETSHRPRRHSKPVTRAATRQAQRRGAKLTM
jgi:hypothetical protein